MSRINGDMRNVSNALETVNAAATAIASAETRIPQSPVVQKRRWGSCFGIYWCFGSQKHNKRIGRAVLVPEPPPAGTTAPPAQIPTQPPSVRMPFVAPPSSPASFLQSEPPSATQSPAGLVSLSSCANAYSPGGPRSIFAIGPYAHETQLVSPPVFSTYTTEPSTAPYTPPPESVHLTTPSSPEVPFAQLLDPSHRRGDVGQRWLSSHYEFQSYHLQPGSPVGPLISPGSAFSGSGTSSPFPDREFFPGPPYFPDIRYGVPPKLLSHELGASREQGSQQESGTVTPNAVKPNSHNDLLLDRQDSVVSPLPNPPNGYDPRVSFELNAEDVVRCVEKKPTSLPRALKNTEDNNDEISNIEEGQRSQKHQRAVSLGSIKEFNFDHANGLDPDRPCIDDSNWWTNNKTPGREGEPSENWAFFPMMQPGIS